MPGLKAERPVLCYSFLDSLEQAQVIWLFLTSWLFHFFPMQIEWRKESNLSVEIIQDNRTEKGISHMDKDIPFWKGEKSWERYWDWRQFVCPKQHDFLIRIKLSSHPLVNWCFLTSLSVSEAIIALKIKFVDLAFTWGKETSHSSEILGLPFPGLSSWRKLEH